MLLLFLSSDFRRTPPRQTAGPPRAGLGRLPLVMREAQQLDVARVQISAAVLPFDDVISDDALRWRGASGPLASIAAFPLAAGDQRMPFARRVELLRHIWRGLHTSGEGSNEESESPGMNHD